MTLAVNYAFLELNLNRMELQVYSHNLRDQKCYFKVGFKKEGRRKQAIFTNGEYYDSILMAILQAEWKKREK